MARVLVLLVLAILGLSAVMPVLAQEEKLYVAEVLPAPIGYSLTFQKPYPSYIYGYRDAGGNFHPYRVDLGGTGTMILVDKNLYVDKIISSDGTGKLRMIDVEKMNKAYGVNLPGSNDIIMYGGGAVYLSHYNIYINTMPPPNTTGGSVLVINEYLVDFRYAGKYSIGLAVPSPTSPITVTTKDGLVITTRLNDLLGVDEACVSWFQNNPPGVPWAGGVIMSPACTKNIKVIKTYTYEDRPYAVVFTAYTKYGKIDYVMLAHPIADVLEDAGIIMPVRVNPAQHIISGVSLEDMYIYSSPSNQTEIAKGTIVDARDATQIITSNNKKEYVCVLPTNHTIKYMLLWRSRKTYSTLHLGPGEAVLFKSGSQYYFCHGDLSWLRDSDMPVVKASAFREIVQPILLYTVSGKPFLLIISNGEAYSTNRIEIPFSTYRENMIYIYAVGIVQPLFISQTSIFTSPFFILAVLFVGILVGLVVFGRAKKEPEKIKIILDFPRPRAMTIATRDTLHDIIRKHVDQFGVCPDIYDIAIYHNTLPPLPEKIESPHQEIILCPFRTNQDTEVVLRKVADILLCSMWANKRVGRSNGFFYTLIGDTMLYTYWYKHENEKNPAEIIVNAVEKAYRTKIMYPYHKQPLGLVIIVEDELEKSVKKELEYMRLLSSSEAVKGYPISAYISVKNISTRIPPEKLQKFANEKIPRIIVVSSRNIHELIEYLEERLTSFAHLYYKLLRGGA